MSLPVSPAPSPSLAPLSASPEPRALVLARCGHYIFASSSTIDSLDTELFTGCDLRAKLRDATNAMTAEDQDEESSDGALKAWRKCRVDLANFELEAEGTDGFSACYEFTLEQQKKLSRDVALRALEGDELEELKAEMEAEERAAATAVMQADMGTTITTTNDDAQIATSSNSTTYASKSALKGARAGRGLSTQINHNNKRLRSPSVTRAASVTIAAYADVDGDEDPYAHHDEDSYRSSSEYYRSAPKSILYTPGHWAPLPRHPFLDTSGSTVTYDRWERLATDNHNQVTVQPTHPAQLAQPTQLRRSERLRPRG
jgi:hypothetical protein